MTLALPDDVVTTALLGQPLAVPELGTVVDEVPPFAEPELLPWLEEPPELLEPLELPEPLEVFVAPPQATSNAARKREHMDKSQ